MARSDKNVRATRIKLSRVKALKFKKSARKVPSVNMEVIQDCVDNINNGKAAEKKVPIKKLLTKKLLLRKERKDAMRKCFAAKRLKYKLTSADAMEGAPLPEEAEVITQKLNAARINKNELPISVPSKNHKLKVRAKELAISNVVSGRRMSKKKARKVLNATRRDEREKERNAVKMEEA